MNTRVGVTYLRLGDPVQAMPYFRKSLAIRRELSQAAPANLSNRLDVARSLLAIGDNSFRVEDRATAVASFDECLGIVEEVFQKSPEEPGGEAGTGTGQFDEGRLPPAGRRDREGPSAVRAGAGAHQGNRGRRSQEVRLPMGPGARTLPARTAGLAGEGCGGREAQFESCLAVREKLAKQDPGNDRRQMELMLVLAHCGKHTEAAAIATKLLGGVTDGELLIDVARCYAQCAAAVKGDESLRERYFKEAMQAIERACKQGYRDVVYLGTEVDFDPLRTQEGFRQILESIRRNAGSPVADGK